MSAVNEPEDVVVAVLTPEGRGALAVVGVAGPRAVDLVADCATIGGVPLADRPDGAVCLARWRSPGSPGEDLVVVRHTRDRIEVHSHGGAAAPAAVVASLVGRGARLVDWREWMAAEDRAAGVAEALELACRVTAPRAARIVMRQAAGAFAAERNRILHLLAGGSDAEAREACARLRRASRVGVRLARPWRVVLTGEVNAGKSSLLNALAGHSRSLVAATPGTTRDLVETRLVLDGWEVVVVDTAGLRIDTAGPTERAGIARAVAARADADLVVEVRDATTPPTGEPVAGGLVVAAKCDRVAAAAVPAGALPTSALTGHGLERLVAEIVARLVPEMHAEPGLLDGAVPLTSRQVESLPA